MSAGQPLGRRATALLAIAALASFGCVVQERRELLEAREAHRACVEKHSEAHPECRDLQAKVDALSRDYEQQAQRGWSCNPANPECPHER